MTDMRSDADLLNVLIANSGRSPDGCSECPFATIDPHDDDGPNPFDPDEGYYDCALLGRARIWGEDPPCTTVDWLTHLRKANTEPISS